MPRIHKPEPKKWEWNFDCGKCAKMQYIPELDSDCCTEYAQRRTPVKKNYFDRKAWCDAYEPIKQPTENAGGTGTEFSQGIPQPL